jgi:Flp pilus assembly protein TadD
VTSRASKALRDTLLKNPNDLEALRALGRALLQAHDPHAARLVLQRAVESGGDYSDLNLLGVACYEAGDKMGAMTAFGKARESGSTGAAANLATLYREVAPRRSPRKWRRPVRRRVL